MQWRMPLVRQAGPGPLHSHAIAYDAVPLSETERGVRAYKLACIRTVT